MKLLKRPGSIALVLATLLVLLALWFLFSAWGFAALKCPECDCRYELSKPGCRSPVIYLWLSLATLLAALALFIGRWIWLNRRNEAAHSQTR